MTCSSIGKVRRGSTPIVTLVDALIKKEAIEMFVGQSELKGLTQDEYGVVHNSSETYATLAKILHTQHMWMMGWSDDASSHLDVLLAVVSENSGPLNTMDTNLPKMVIGVSRMGIYGFNFLRFSPLHPAYVAEKLGMRLSPTTEALTDLVNGVLEAYVSMEDNDA